MNYPTKQQAIDFANSVVPWYNLDKMEAKYFRTSHRRGECAELVFINGETQKALEETTNFRFFKDGTCIFTKPNHACELNLSDAYNEYISKVCTTSSDRINAL